MAGAKNKEKKNKARALLEGVEYNLNINIEKQERGGDGRLCRHLMAFSFRVLILYQRLHEEKFNFEIRLELGVELHKYLE